MITARWRAPCSLEISGHAGYAPAGQDIVCAGVSTLYGVLVAELDERERRGEGTVTTMGGIVSFQPETEEIKGIYAMVWRGILLLAAQYGKYIDAQRTW